MVCFDVRLGGPGCYEKKFALFLKALDNLGGLDCELSRELVTEVCKS